ncbi:MAG: MBL fold metallo-hydrolase [Campylobacteraceae bacterium]|jgi:glyoxylase-like metal-dependent hydrolase (beta-lactamase superfamily II)|nr:MBL fold metallo-hydrolase [Campylobacteraceae bacterium]
MSTGEKTVTNIKTYYCGYCTNNLKLVFKGQKDEKRQFPAAAVLFKHNGDYMLFDTGYSKRVLQNGIISKIYNALNPIHFEDKDSLKAQLELDGILPSQIKTIIISHLHADHIGGLKDFPQSQIIISRKELNSLKDLLVFKNLLPDDFLDRIVTTQKADIFGDNSVILIDLPGHTEGQIGILFSEYNRLYAADSCWGGDLLGKPMKLIARKIQSNYTEYLRSQEKIKQMISDGVEVIFTHEVNL